MGDFGERELDPKTKQLKPKKKDLDDQGEPSAPPVEPTDNIPNRIPVKIKPVEPLPDFEIESQSSILSAKKLGKKKAKRGLDRK